MHLEFVAHLPFPSLQTALGSADEEICVERGGAPAPPQFSSHNPSWLVTDPCHEVSPLSC